AAGSFLGPTSTRAVPAIAMVTPANRPYLARAILCYRSLTSSKGGGTVSQPQARRRLNVDLVEGIVLVTFTAPRIVQEEDIQATFEQLQRLTDEKPGREYVLDFRKVQFLSSSVLGRLILLQKQVASTKGRLVLCSIAREIFEVFKITKL